MKKLCKKILCFILSLLIVVPMAACQPTTGGGGNGNDSKVSISVFFNRCGVQSGWFKQFVSQYENLVAEKQFGSHTGVKVNWEEATVTPFSNAKTSSYNVYLDSGDGAFKANVAQGIYMDITDLVNMENPYNEIDPGTGTRRSVASYLVDNGRKISYIKDDKYYGIPWAEYYYGVTYDRDLFDEYGFYFAASQEGATPYTCVANVDGVASTYYFVGGNPNCAKTLGLDGVAGTYDDGLPTSLEELVALCDKIKSEGISPFACTGGIHQDYTNYFLAALIAGLEGENMNTFYTCDGEVEIVDGYEQGQWLWGINGLAEKPITRKVTVDPNDQSTWVNLSKTASKYYAFAMLKLIIEKDWFGPDITTSTSNNISTQGNFIFSNTDMETEGYRSAMIMEGTHWYTESEYNGNWSNWDSYLPGEPRKEMGHMPYIAQVEGTFIEEEVQSRQTIIMGMDTGSKAWINNNLMADPVNNADVIAACKDFLLWFFSEQQLLNYTEATGQLSSCKNYDWESVLFKKDASTGEYTNEPIENCKVAGYLRTVLECRRDGIYMLTSATETNPTNLYNVGLNSAQLLMDLGCIYKCFIAGKTVRDCLTGTQISAV